MNIKTKIFRHLRSKKQLLVLLLEDGQAQLSLWQQGASLWQEQFNQQLELTEYEAAAFADAEDKQARGILSAELEDWLRDVLLAHDVEEDISLLMVLGDDLLQTEQLTLPRLPAKQLKKTLAWEVQQLFNLPQGSYSFCYKVLAANAETIAQKERGSGKQEAEQQVLQLWALEYARQAEYAALAQRLMVKLVGLCVGVAVKQLHTKQLEAAEEEVQDDDMLAATVAQSWFAGEALLLLPVVPKRISWQQCYERCEQYLPLAAKIMTACACFAFMSAFGLRYLAQEDLAAVQQEAAHYAVWRERQEQSTALEKQVTLLKKQSEKHQAQTSANKELERWGRLELTDVYLTELEYKTSSKQGKQQGMTVAQGVAIDTEALDALLDKLQAGKQYSSVQLMESQQQAGGVGFRLQLNGGSK